MMMTVGINLIEAAWRGGYFDRCERRTNSLPKSNLWGIDGEVKELHRNTQLYSKY